MGTALSAPSAFPQARPQAHEVERLRREIARMQRRRSDARTLPLDPALAGLLPDGGLRVGVSYSITPSPSLLGALFSAASQSGAWCAAVAMPTIGAEAMAGFGVDLDRLVLVPDPGPRWLSVVSALSEVIPLIAVHPRSRATEGDISRLHARLRDRGCTLLVTAGWAHSTARIQIEDTEWHGLGSGWGLLSDRTVTLRATTRGQAAAQRVRVRLPGAQGGVDAVPVTPLVPLTRPGTPSIPGAMGTENWAVAG